MSLHSRFVFIIIIIFFVAARSAADCSSSRCGDIEIPYPFGVEEGCYLDDTFRITCDEATGSAALAWLSWDVDRISLADHTFRHKNFTGVTMRFKTPGEAYVDYASPAVGSHYSISHAHNTFVAMGCDFFVSLVDEEDSKVRGSCSSLCNIKDTTPLQQQELSTCAGLNCCQISFPAHLRNLSVRVQTVKNSLAGRGSEASQSQSQCGFFTFVDNNLLRLNKIKISCNESYVVPMIHEWAVGTTHCDEARGREDYLCRENTECVDYDTGIGRYRCQCMNGYTGNPYLPQGCQDIDECGNHSDNKCPSGSRCLNTAGGYYCLPNRKRTLALVVPLGTGLAAGILALAAIAIWSWRKVKAIKATKTKQKLFKKNGGLLLQQQMISSSAAAASRGSLLPEVTIFKIEELEKATDRFNKSRIVGGGGVGTVFKGMLPDGMIVAVKKANAMNGYSTTQVNQFINEVVILSQINHRHIVKLHGCCLEAQVPLLVYEYIANGTLSHHLHNHNHEHGGGGAFTLSWENRLRIAWEVAEALAYLHSSAATAIFHRDMKSSNILLDQNYRAVVSDFGLSRWVAVDKTHLTTSSVGGTFGYLDPHYFWSGRLNDKSDVYGFGVVLAEILTGEKAISEAADDDDDQGLAQRFRLAVKENRLVEIVERSVAYEGEEEEIWSVAKLAGRCLKLKAEKRPSMRQVAAELDHRLTNIRIRRRRRNNQP
ncbi:wall-associated receptor kinase-like 18 [Andrographis paniculata]|uniref:wall-associated receptor kinase-like 18 n=1 Tax=Andrographis paniculata TaxID=175694 RepID=UPI0021E72DD9|nr:wall-associated receptor kinase-like 18 [Andrographis paniculata]